MYIFLPTVDLHTLTVGD